MTDYDEIKVSLDGPIGVLTLNNPKKINALSIRMVAEITDALDRVARDETVRVLIIRAEGKHFCAGHYLAEMVDLEMKEYRDIFANCTRMMQKIQQIPQPVIAEVRGIATAAGCQIVATCDLAVAEEGAKFATPGVKIGLFCTTPMVALTRAIGRKAAMEMLLTGRYVAAAEAKEIGLINRVTTPENLSSETEELARKIAEASGFVVGIGKQAFYSLVDQPDEEAYTIAGGIMTMNAMAEDAAIGIKAFLSKEKPEWKNR